MFIKFAPDAGDSQGNTDANADAGGKGGAGDQGDASKKTPDQGQQKQDQGGDQQKDGQTKDVQKQDQGKQQQTDKKDAAPVVPDKYELKLPDGVIVHDDMMGKFTTWAKKHNFTQEQAQEAAELHMESVAAFAETEAGKQIEQQAAWIKEIHDDKEIGGVKADATIATARRVLDVVAPTIPGVNVKRLRNDLNRTGMGDHPDLLRIWHFFGKTVGEDGRFVSGAGGTEPKDAASILYKNTTSKAG